MRKLVVVLLILVALAIPLFILPMFASADSPTVSVDVLDDDMKEEKNETTTKPRRMSNILESGMKEVKPLDLNNLNEKIEKLGDDSYNLLQKGSLPLLVWGIGISVVTMFLGILLGKRVVMAGVLGLIISFSIFSVIQFAPEAAITVMQGIRGLVQ